MNSAASAIGAALQNSGMIEFAVFDAVWGVAFEVMVVPSIGGTWWVMLTGYAYWFIAAHISVVADQHRRLFRRYEKT